MILGVNDFISMCLLLFPPPPFPLFVLRGSNGTKPFLKFAWSWSENTLNWGRYLFSEVGLSWVVSPVWIGSNGLLTSTFQQNQAPYSLSAPSLIDFKIMTPRLILPCLYVVITPNICYVTAIPQWPACMTALFHMKGDFMWFSSVWGGLRETTKRHSRLGTCVHKASQHRIATALNSHLSLFLNSLTSTLKRDDGGMWI